MNNGTLIPPPDKLAALRKRFNRAEWEWFMADERCQNIIQGESYFGALFYLQFRLPRRVKALPKWAED